LKFLNKRGSTTVLLSLFLASMLAVIGVYLHAASKAAARSYVDAIFELAGKSILSEYDRRLFEEYGVFAVKAEESQVEKKLEYYAKSSFHTNKVEEFIKNKKYIDLLKLDLQDVKVDLKDYSLINVDVFEEQILDFMKYRIIQKVLPGKETNLSESQSQSTPQTILRNQKIIGSLPSNGYQGGNLDINKLLDEGIPTLQEIKDSSLECFYVNEYILDQFLHQRKNSLEERKTFFRHEVEYILTGKWNDEENYKHVRNNLVIMRTALNLTHIYADPAKREEVLALASVMTPGPEAVATQLLLATAWAGAEAENDARLLEQGKKVALIKTSVNWSLDFQSILSGIGNGSAVEPEQMNGMDYEDYIRVFLYFLNREIKLLRCLDLIQLNMKGNYGEEFDLRNYYGGLQFEAVVQGRKYAFRQKF
jgi:hypothetical protein